MSDQRNSAPARAPDPSQRDPVVDMVRAVFTGASAATRQAKAGVASAATQVSRVTTDVAANAARTAAAVTVSGVKKIRFRVIAAWLLRLTFLPVLVLTYVVVSAEGLRGLFDGLAIPLHRFLPLLARWKETKRIDVAVVLSLVLLSWAWLAWERVVRIYLWPPGRLENEEKFLWLVGCGLLALDAVLFFLGIQAGGGFLVSAGTSLFAAVVITALYVLMLMFASYLIVTLDK